MTEGLPRRVLRGRILPWAVAGVMAAAAVAFAAAWRGQRAVEERRQEVAAETTAFLEALTTFSAETIEADVERIRAWAVGGFAGEVEETFGPPQVRAIQEGEVRSVGEVRTVAVQSLEDESATVFGVVDQTVTNAASPSPTTEVLRVEVGLIETAAGWRVDRVEILQSPPDGLVGG